VASHGSGDEVVVPLREELAGEAVLSAAAAPRRKLSSLMLVVLVVVVVVVLPGKAVAAVIVGVVAGKGVAVGQPAASPVPIVEEATAGGGP
jgi:hypothetical protein